VSDNPAAQFLCSTARIRQDISADSFCICKLLWGSDECVLLPCFNAHSDIFAVMNYCVIALSLFPSDILTWSAIFSAMTHKLKGSVCTAMYNPNGLLSQKSCRYLNQGRTLYVRLMRAAHWMAYFDLIKLIKLIHWMRSNHNCNGNRRDKMALRTTCITNVKLKIITIRTACQYVKYFYYSET